MGKRPLLIPRRLGSTVVLATIPYLLLSSSQSTKLQTDVYWSGAGMRRVEVSTEALRQKEVRRWIGESDLGLTPGRAITRGNTVQVAGSRIAAKLDSVGKDAKLRTQLVYRPPFGLFTYYYWSDVINIQQSLATTVELVGQNEAKLSYEVTLPGTVVQEAVSPTAKVQGHTVTWEIPGSQPQVNLEAKSALFRWDVLVVFLYIIAFFGYRIVVRVERIMANRPRRI
jgi:hypothetical protein